MNQIFDIFGNPEKPQIILTKPTGEEVFEIGNYSEFKTDIRYNDVSEISFVVYDDGNSRFNLIKGKKYLNISGYGIFIIVEATVSDNGITKRKDVKCKSVDYELSYKRITLESTTYKLYDPISPQDTLIARILEKIPSWSIGSVDFSVGSLYRYFDIEDTDILSFMFSELENAYQCVVEFDYELRKINIKALENVGSNTNIYLSFDNLVESIDINELSDEIVTNLRVYGGNDLSIRSVNPSGTDSILNLSYFKNTEWMSQSLIDAIQSYEALYSSKSSLYSSYLLSYKSINEEIVVLEGQLALLENELNALVEVQKTKIQAGQSISSTYTDIVNKQNQITSKENEIANKVGQLNTYIDLLNGIVDNLSLQNNFTSQQILDLDKFTITYTYQNSAYIVTDSMSEKEKTEQAEMLLADGQEILARLSQPRFSFKINSADFLKLSGFSSFTDKFELACKVYIEFGEDNVIESRLISYSHDWDNNQLELEFTSKYRTNDPTYTYDELYKKSVSAGISVSFGKFTYKDWSANSKDEVTAFIKSSLDASLNNLVSTSNQDIIIDGSGLRGRQSDGLGGFLPEQVWMTNNMIAFTNNSWQTAKMAIGKINDSVFGQNFGIVGDVIVGNILAGNNLRITNTANQFVLDQNGATLNNAKFTLTTDNNKGKIILDPAVGIKIQGNSTGSFVDNFYVGLDGRIKATSLDISGNSTFSGTITVGAGSQGLSNFAGVGALAFVNSLSIDQIVNAGNLASLDTISSVYIQDGAIVAGKIAAGAVLANNIAAGSVTAGKISVDYLSAINTNIGTINAGTINGITINGTSINGGTITGSIFRSSNFSGYDGVYGSYNQYLEIANDSVQFNRVYSGGYTNVYSITTPRGGSRDGSLALYSSTSIELDSSYGVYSNGSRLATDSDIYSALSNYFTKTETLTTIYAFGYITRSDADNRYVTSGNNAGDIDIVATSFGITIRSSYGAITLPWD